MAPSGPDIFLSYAREDEVRVRELATALDQRGYSVFWDREVPPGQTWHSYIGEALANARCVVVVWSRHSIASRWVLDEASEGRDRQVLVPVLLEPVSPPFGFRAIQGANLTDWRPGGPSPAFDGLVGAVQRIVGGQSGSETRAEPEKTAPPQSASSEPAPTIEPAATSATPSPISRPKPVAALPGRASRWSGLTMAATVLVGAVLAGGGAFLWGLNRAEPPPSRPAAEPSTPQERPAEPADEAEPAGSAQAPSEAETPKPGPGISAPAVVTGAREASKTREPAQEMPDCPGCPQMVWVPAGEFTMGSPPDEPGRDDDEGPERTVTILEPFWVSKYEVTFVEWDACLAAAQCTHKEGDHNRPVTVSWDQAKAYVGWLTEMTGKEYRLLSEAEWEYASRAGSRTAFWWGEGVGSDNANCSGCGGRWGARTTAPVGSFKANDFGLYDTAGNVWEWVEDCYHDNYEDAPTDGAPRLDGECTGRVRRGGSWVEDPKSVRSASRDRSEPDHQSSRIGFRVARTAD